jgi:hypothetical protein
MTKPERNPKPEARNACKAFIGPALFQDSGFELLSDFGIRISDFAPINSQPTTIN